MVVVNRVTPRSIFDIVRNALQGCVESLAGPVMESNGLEWHAGVGWTEGAIQDLFMSNMTDVSGSPEKAILMKRIMDIISNDADRLTVHQVLGRGKCGKVEDVEFADFPGERFALKTIEHVSCSPMR